MSWFKWPAINDWLTKQTPTRLRYWLYSSALALLGGFIILNQIFLTNLQTQAETVSHKEARLYAVAIAEQLNRDELNVIFNEIVRKSQVPMIITDNENLPINWKNIDTHPLLHKNKEVSQVPFSDLSALEQRYLKKTVLEFDKKNPPLRLEAEGHSFGFLHYNDLPLVNLLIWMPALEALIIFLFVFIAYFGFQIIRANEHSLLWVGLAKETAHQLGTPISSLLGWIEYLKVKLGALPDPEKNLSMLGEMESDIQRLIKVATRFSQIGSIPELKLDSLNEIAQNLANYFKTRLPHVGKRITIELSLKEQPKISMNRELISWVLENLIRNAIDSIEVTQGLIIISTDFHPSEQTVQISVADNGKGIPKENLRHIFRTGFTTKKRGWGLGLSLAKRIVAEYHEGRIFVETSQKDNGTTFVVMLPVTPLRSNRKAKV